MSVLKLLLAAVALAGGALPCDAQPHSPDESPAPLTVVTRSALVALEAGAAPEGVTVRLRRTAEQTRLPVTDLAVSVGGARVPATARADGAWFAPLAHPVAAGDTLEVLVGHDGIREVLDGRFAAAGAAPASPSSASGTTTPDSPSAARPAGGAVSFWRAHKQMAWWILNITVVLIAVLAISRRMS